MMLCYAHNGNSAASVYGWIGSHLAAGSPAASEATFAAIASDEWIKSVMNHSASQPDWLDGALHNSLDFRR